MLATPDLGVDVDDIVIEDEDLNPSAPHLYYYDVLTGDTGESPLCGIARNEDEHAKTCACAVNIDLHTVTHCPACGKPCCAYCVLQARMILKNDYWIVR